MRGRVALQIQAMTVVGVDDEWERLCDVNEDCSHRVAPGGSVGNRLLRPECELAVPSQDRLEDGTGSFELM